MWIPQAQRGGEEMMQEAVARRGKRQGVLAPVKIDPPHSFPTLFPAGKTPSHPPFLRKKSEREQVERVRPSPRTLARRTHRTPERRLEKKRVGGRGRERELSGGGGETV